MRHPKTTIVKHVLVGLFFSAFVTAVSAAIISGDYNKGIEYIFAMFFNLPGIWLAHLAGGDPRAPHLFLAYTGIALQWAIVGTTASWLIDKIRRRKRSDV